MENPKGRFSPEIMSFTDLLDEYLRDRAKLSDLSEEGTRRLAEVKFEIDTRCPPKPREP